MIHNNIKNFEAGQKVLDIYMVKDATVAVSARGNEYMKLTLQDATGTFSANAWFVDRDITSGKIVSVDMDIQTYNDKLNGIVKSMVVIDDPTQEQMATLLPYTPYNIDDMWQKLQVLIEGITDSELRLLVSTMITEAKDKYLSMPGARGVHHDTIGGLLQHTVEMAQTAHEVSRIYKIVNRDLLISGTILHDYAKIREFSLNEYGLCDRYSLEGNLLGHLHMGAVMVEEKGRQLGISEEKILLLKHMLLSHHGNREWGAVQLPAIPEASMLFLIDMMSSRMEIYRKEYDKLESGTISAESCRYLDGVYVFKHSMTPAHPEYEMPMV